MTDCSLPLAEHRVVYRRLRRKPAGENSGQFGLNILAARLVEQIKVFSRVVVKIEQLAPLWTIKVRTCSGNPFCQILLISDLI